MRLLVEAIGWAALAWHGGSILVEGYGLIPMMIECAAGSCAWGQ